MCVCVRVCVCVYVCVCLFVCLSVIILEKIEISPNLQSVLACFREHNVFEISKICFIECSVKTSNNYHLKAIFFYTLCYAECKCSFAVVGIYEWMGV